MVTAKRKNNEWYSEEAGFFGSGYLKEYASVLSLEKTKKEVAFLVKALHLKRGMKILDLCCGHGRHTIPLAKKGYVMTGQDINGFFLKEAVKATERAKLKIRWIKSDMGEIPFEEEFNVVLNLFTAFGYFEKDKENEKVLHQVAKALKRKGKFFIDVQNRERIIKQFSPNNWRENEDNSFLLERREFDFVTGSILEQRIRISKKGKIEKLPLITLRMYTVAELVAMCKRAGLHIKSIYGDYDEVPLTFESKRCIIVAEKK